MQAEVDEFGEALGVGGWNFGVHSLHDFFEEAFHAGGSEGRLESAELVDDAACVLGDVPNDQISLFI